MNTIFNCYDLFIGWDIGNPISTYATRGMVGRSSKMCTGAYRRRGLSLVVCMRALTLSLLMFLSYGALFYSLKFNLTFIKGVFVRHG